MLRARLKGEVEYPWIYFHSVSSQSLSHTFIHFARSIRTQQSLLVEKSVTTRPVKKDMRAMFKKLINSQQAFSFTGIEIEIVEKFSDKDRIEGLTVGMHCLRRTKQEALDWLLKNKFRIQTKVNPSGIDPETIKTLFQMPKK